MTTIHARLAEGRRRLSEAGIDHDEAALDARLLAQVVLGWDAARILTSGDQSAPESFAAAYDELISRRAHREPLAYITGSREFWNLSFYVSPAVLIPRPETEGLIEALIEAYPERDRRLRIADVCTGSGCVAVAAAYERPRARVVATDISGAALAVARQNALHHNVGDRVHLICSDLLTGVNGTFDLIMANPPYVRAIDRARLPPEVRRFEPAAALLAGPEGLDVIRRLVVQSVPRLAAEGQLMFEFGAGQESAVRELISTTGGLTMIDVKRDLQGIARIAVAERRA